MITRGAPIGAVCFRCRLRLLRQLTPVRYFGSDANHAARDHSDQANDDDDAPRVTDQDRDADTGPHQNPVKYVRPFIRLALNKRHRSGYRVLDEGAKELGSDMLGKPAYAIIMRDGGNVPKKIIPLDPTDPTREPDDLAGSVEALLESQKIPPTLDEVRSNIEELRPETDKVLPKKEFEKLQRLLTNGFLMAQLKEYLEWRRSEAQKAAVNTSKDPELPWISKITPWAPLEIQPDAGEGTDLTPQSYIPGPTGKKQRLVLCIMRECWDLSTAEESQTQLGETRIKVRTREFTLLMRGSQRFMNNVGKNLLGRGEKIEAFRDENTLRLVTTKPKVEQLVANLQDILKNVKTKTFPVLLTGLEAPDPSVLEELGRIANAEVKTSHTLQRIHVTWIELESRVTQRLLALEDVGHIVFRLLLTSFGDQRATSTLLSPVVSKLGPGRLVVDVTSKDKLSWRDRLVQWARYVHPLAPGESVADAPLPVEEFELPFEPTRWPETLGGDHQFFRDTKFPQHPVKWSDLPVSSTVAHFGHVLHGYRPSDPALQLSDLLASTDRRAFAPASPHPLHLAQTEQKDADAPSLITTKSTLVLRFWPSPSSNPVTRPGRSKPVPSHAGDTPPAPILELRIPADNPTLDNIESLRAISRTHHTDVMLPSSPVDVRFTQTQYSTLLATDRETAALWQPIADFLLDAHIDLDNGKAEVKPRQRFPIPRSLFDDRVQPAAASDVDADTDANANADAGEPGDSARRKKKSSKDGLIDSADLQSIPYEFVGMEFHSSVSLPYEGHQLTYTSIEAGRGGGRRAELTLELVESTESAPPPTGAADNSKLKDDFLACCSKLAADRSMWTGPSSSTQIDI
ncbi:putative rmp1 protein involved in nucleus-mitochondria cross-talk encoded by the rpm1 gene [Rosellinia necatrix]|uniref:Putative rmp1 protein involved in nucleus-mitochondria cross-talk encoded by the rpm1 protein n=1 Tax=Rosellinia necatrix TaxID=77044 RepID=A0A1W2TS80_ROSNE|nr:putative rmp1 protein involved in nucleus-mitochondria cross-talk encoded by the rpm1 gene [Rosellinia necatrix]